MTRRTALHSLTSVGLVAGLPKATGTSEENDFEPAASLRIKDAHEVAVDDSGTIAYVATEDGFAVLDVRDSSSPKVLAERRNIPPGRGESFTLVNVSDVSASGNRLLVAGPAEELGDDNHTMGFLLFDVSDPANPEWLTKWEVDSLVTSASLDGRTAYVIAPEFDDGSLVVIDALEYGSERVATWSVEEEDEAWKDIPNKLYRCRDVSVLNDIAYVACGDAGTWLLDVSDPTTPEVVSTVGGRTPTEIIRSGIHTETAVRELPGNSFFARPNEDGSLLAVGRRTFIGPETPQEGGSGGISIWGVTDPTDPEYHTTIVLEATSRVTLSDLRFRDDRLYTSWWREGVKVYDVFTPTEPTQIAEWRMEPGFWNPLFQMVCPVSDGVIATVWPDPPEVKPGRRAKRVTFPVPSDENPKPVKTLGAVAKNGGRAEFTTTTSTETNTPTTETGTPTATQTTTEPSTDFLITDAPASTTTDGQPGFGVLGALAAGGVATWRRLRGRHADES